MSKGHSDRAYQAAVLLALMVGCCSAVRRGRGVHATDHKSARQGDEAGVTVLTISTNHSATGLHYLKESLTICSQHGLHYKLKVLGKDGGEYTMWHSKFMEIINTLREIPDEELIIICDSHDVMFLPCGRNLRHEFAKFKSGIVTGGTLIQVPDRHKEFLFPSPIEYDKSTPFQSEATRQHFETAKFIDGGVIMVRAAALKHFIAEFYLRASQINAKHGTWDMWDDQTFWTDLYLAQSITSAPDRGRHPHIAIDSEGLLSQGWHPAYIYRQDVNTKFVSAFDHDDSQLYKHPGCIFHAPGGSSNRDPMSAIFYQRWLRGEQDLFTSQDRDALNTQ